MYYYLFCQTFTASEGKVESHIDDNAGDLYTYEEAEARQKELKTLRIVNGCYVGTDVYICEHEKGVVI